MKQIRIPREMYYTPGDLAEMFVTTTAAMQRLGVRMEKKALKNKWKETDFPVPFRFAETKASHQMFLKRDVDNYIANKKNKNATARTKEERANN